MKLVYDVDSMVVEMDDKTIQSRTYSYCISGYKDEEYFQLSGTESWTCEEGKATLFLPAIGLRICRSLEQAANGCREKVCIQNDGKQTLRFTKLDLGYLFPLHDQSLHAIPFTVQQDGMRHIYSADTLKNGQFRAFVNDNVPTAEECVYGNSVYSDPSRVEPELWEEGRLRSEAWFWGTERGGLLVAKYNNVDIEYSIAEPVGEAHEQLRLGGVGFCLYGEPCKATQLSPGAAFTFGDTYYIPCESFMDACYQYRDLLDAQGHGLPVDYTPKVHWNELYDIGWYHSDRYALQENYTLERILQEAQKAKECGCDALYLDPGWEFAEGTTFFDHHRLGNEKDLVNTLKTEYGLDLSIRCILRTYVNYWPSDLNVVHSEGGIATACMTPKTIIPSGQLLYEQCLCNPAFFEEKAKRIEKIVEDGASFLMFDEMDWRGPCYAKNHGHEHPSTAMDHATAICDLAKRLKEKYSIPIEVHDPIWPWNTAVYTPTYWRQGFGPEGSYAENWGFEFMWDCIHDLQSGKALSLYYYNLSCNIPLYLHINMSADNDQCLFFWWAASTIRHLGIGGKQCHKSVVPPGKQFAFDPEERFAAYRACMMQYRALKEYYQRGIFYGIHEYAHLHVLPQSSGGVLDLFNCANEPQACTAKIPTALLKDRDLKVVGGECTWEEDYLCIEATIPALSHGLVRIGDAAEIEICDAE